MRPNPNADCPKERALQEVAAEMASPEISTQVLQHAAQCDHCGPLLKQYLDDFSDELSPEIEALIDQLPFSQPQWQRQKAREIARKLRPEPIPWWKRFTDLWSAKWVPATAGTMAVLAGIGIVSEPVIMNWWQIREIEKLIAHAYQSQPLETRFTGIPYAHPQKSVTTMSSEAQDWNQPLGKAAQLCSQPKADPRACQYKGRLLLLYDPKDSESAVKAFTRAQELGLDTASLRIDLGIADLLHAKNSDAHDYAPAIRKLKEVLDDKTAGEDERKTAQFNLALAYELSGAHELAIAAWNEYLSMDSSGGWAGEARTHLDKLSPKPQ
jgi:tetratricopeptide (TPR) repeat protein